MDKTKTHTFTESGLGEAPFKVVGFWSMPSRSAAESNPDFYREEMKWRPRVAKGVCDHCGRAITHHCIIASDDGQRSAVGIECVKKTGDLGIIGKSDLAKRKAAKERSFREREQKILARLRAERIRYNGLTEDQFDSLCRDRYNNAILDIADEIATELDHKGGRFCNDMAGDLRRGNLPYGRANEIVEKIVSETKGVEWYRKSIARIAILKEEGPRGFASVVLRERGVKA